MVSVRGLGGNRFDVHAALGGADECHPRAGSVDQAGKIQLAFDGCAFLHIDPIDCLAFGPGLVRHQGLAQHLAGAFTHLVEGFDHPDAALAARAGFLEAPLATAARVYLRLDDPDRATQ